MKKIMIIILTIVLCACSSALKWDDVQDRYAQLSESVENIAQDAKEFTKKDYEGLLDELSEDVQAIQTGISKDDTAAADALYETAVKLEKIAALFSNDSSAQLTLLSQAVKDLVVAAYNKSDGFEDLRNDVTDKIAAIRSWGDDMWRPIEIRPLIKWEEVKDAYDALSEEVLNNLTKKKEVTEEQLVTLKNYITDNYAKIKDGVTQENEEYAKGLYSAALQLQEYTNKMKGDAAAKVNQFATHALEFIMNAYGEPIEDETYDFLNEVDSATKWTLSLWNEIVARLQKENLYDHTR
ncbi:MAG: hypothetical protein IKS69_00095 [Erysipelotrichaceae bacterium]|nr:hypothetical protein [Erysipelotrichaceae bacterium]